MKIGILGATGMLGHHAALAAMAAGHELVVIHRQGSNLNHIRDLSAQYRLGDLEDEGSLARAMNGLDCVVHAAGYYPTIPRPWREDVRLAMSQTETLLRACRSAGMPRLVYVGAAIALRRDSPQSVGDETRLQLSRPGNSNPYIQVKWAMDHHFARASDAGLSVSTAIPAMTFGEFDYGPSTGQLLTRLANGQLPSYVRGNRNVIYAGDAGRGMIAVAEKGRAGERYLLTGTNTSMDELMELGARLAASTVPRPVPLVVASLVSRFQGLRYRLGGPLPAISATAIAVMSAGQHLSGEKARRELGFTPSVGLQDTLQKALHWFREVGYI